MFSVLVYHVSCHKVVISDQRSDFYALNNVCLANEFDEKDIEVEEEMAENVQPSSSTNPKVAERFGVKLTSKGVTKTSKIMDDFDLHKK